MRGRFFESRFQPLSVGGFFSNQRESISRCPKSPFPSKTQNRQIARTSPLKSKLLQQLGWPALRWRRAISSITLFHQMKVAPTSLFVNQLPASSLSRSGRSLRKPEQLLLPPAHTIKFMDSFFYHSAILWNSLPFEIQVMQNNQHFKSAVENHWAPFKFITTDDILSLTTS